MGSTRPWARRGPFLRFSTAAADLPPSSSCTLCAFLPWPPTTTTRRPPPPPAPPCPGPQASAHSPPCPIPPVHLTVCTASSLHQSSSLEQHFPPSASSNPMSSKAPASAVSLYRRVLRSIRAFDDPGKKWYVCRRVAALASSHAHTHPHTPTHPPPPPPPPTNQKQVLQELVAQQHCLVRRRG